MLLSLAEADDEEHHETYQNRRADNGTGNGFDEKFTALAVAHGTFINVI